MEVVKGGWYFGQERLAGVLLRRTSDEHVMRVFHLVKFAQQAGPVFVWSPIT